MKDKIAQLLKEAMGLDIATIGAAPLDSALRTRMRETRAGSLDHYWRLLQTAPAELQELIEAIVVPETWFFRDRDAFFALAKIVTSQWLPQNPGRTLRLLSIPCSTGEEPYSVAMALLDAEVPAAAFRVDAVDISARVLALADRAIYGKNSFRVADLAFRERHFTEVQFGWRLAPAVKERVSFHQANLLTPDFFSAAPPYDIVFCRNLLIYFDQPTQEHVVQKLGNLLLDTGYIFVGPSETFLLRQCGFHSANEPRAFVYRKQNPATHETTPPPSRTWIKPLLPSSTPARRQVPLQPKPARPAPISTPPAPSSPKVLLAEAERMADHGRLAEAKQLCETVLTTHGPSADTYYLLGVVAAAQGLDGQSAAHYRKAVYLNPAHTEALKHLALLAEKTGDPAGARRYHDRASRADAGAER